MLFKRNFMWIVLLVIVSVRTEIHHVCEVCTCDNLDQPIVVHCDSKTLSTLTNIIFNSTIETLTFVNNSLTFQSDDDLEIINNITSLKHLDLSDNPLSTIPAFSSVHLVYLKLENTYLTSALFPASYENSTQLQTIVLSNNKLTQMTPDAFKTLPSLTTLFLDHTQLSSIDPTALLTNTNTLQSFSLVANSLQSAEFLSTMTSLLSINFDENNFTKLPIEMIHTGRMKQISFRANLINTIDELSPLFYWMKGNISGTDVYLNPNPFDCCQSRWFIRYLSGSKNLVKDAMNLTCSSPTIYAGQRLIDLRADLMDCSIQPNTHFNKSVIILLSLGGLTMVALLVIGRFLYKRKRLHLRPRQQEYEPIDGDNLPSSI